MFTAAPPSARRRKPARTIARLAPCAIALAVLMPPVAAEGKSRNCYSGSSRIYGIEHASCGKAQGVLASIRRTGKPPEAWDCVEQGGGRRSCNIDPGNARFDSAPRKEKFHRGFATYQGPAAPKDEADGLSTETSAPCRQGPYIITERDRVKCKTARRVLREFFAYGAPGRDWKCRASRSGGGSCTQVYGRYIETYRTFDYDRADSR